MNKLKLSDVRKDHLGKLTTPQLFKLRSELLEALRGKHCECGHPGREHIRWGLCMGDGGEDDVPSDYVSLCSCRRFK